VLLSAVAAGPGGPGLPGRAARTWIALWSLRAWRTELGNGPASLCVVLRPDARASRRDAGAKLGASPLCLATQALNARCAVRFDPAERSWRRHRSVQSSAHITRCAALPS